MSAGGQEGDPWIAFAAERDEVLCAIGIAVLVVMLTLLFGLMLLALL